MVAVASWINRYIHSTQCTARFVVWSMDNTKLVVDILDVKCVGVGAPGAIPFNSTDSFLCFLVVQFKASLCSGGCTVSATGINRYGLIIFNGGAI